MSFKANNPDEIEFTLTKTMPLAQWRKLAGQLESGQIPWCHPAREFISDVRSMVRQAAREFRPEAAKPAREVLHTTEADK